MERLMMYEHRIEGSLYRTMNELQKLPLTHKADGGQCQAYKSEPADEGRDCAKQSQSEEVSSGPSSVPEDSPACETKPIDPDGAVCSVPARASVETQNLASLQGATASEARCAKQSQSAATDGGASPA